MTTMIGILVPSLFFCCGICIYAGFLHLANGLRRPIDIPKLLFALICFTSIPFVISLSQMFKAEELGAFIFALKWNLAAGLWFYIELIWFIALFTKKYSPPLLIALSIIFCVLLLVNYAQPYGLQYSEISSLKTLELPWGEFVSLAIGQVSEWYYYSMIMFFICFCYIFYALIANYRQTGKKHLLGMIFAIAFFMVCVIEGTLARLSIINFIYLGPYGFMGLITVMSMILDHDYHQNLREKDEKLHYLYKLSPLGIALTDMQGRYLEFNEAFSNISGYPADELKNLDYWTLTPKKYASQEAEQLESLQRLGYYGPYEKEYLNKNGELVPIRLNGVLITGSNGQHYIWSIVEDTTLWKQTQEALRSSDERYRLIVETSSEGICSIDNALRITFVNSALSQMLGYAPEQMLGRLFEDFLFIDDIPIFRRQMQLRTQGKSSHYEPRFQCHDGSLCWCSITGTPLKDSQGNQIGSFAMVTDITQRKHAEEEMQLAALVYRASSQGMMITDADNRIITVNPAFAEITGYRIEEVLGHYPNLFKSDFNDETYYEAMWESINNTGKWQGEIWNRRKSGETFLEFLTINTIYRDDGTVYRRVALFSDITEEKKNEELIWRQANYDFLTDLPNRRMVQDRLKEEIKKSRRDKRQLALLFIDIDRFKEVNDAFGHETGDNLLKEASKRMIACMRDTDLVGRLGGDEFVVILSDLHDIGGVGHIANTLLVNLAKPYLLDDESTYISASIGITIYPDDANDESTLLKNADQAMYEAKRLGRNRFHYYTPAMQKAANYRMRITNDLHNAVENNQFRLYYQPIVEMATGAIHKAEALIRWQHPKLGMVSPADFIPIAEDTGQIVNIGHWVFRQAVAQVIRLRANFHPDFQISINKSPVQFTSEPYCHTSWIDHLIDVNLPPQAIVVEITESLLMEVRDEISNQLLTFKDYGIQVALDDFGTGYSSLSYLKKFDIDYIKIDQSFVRNLNPGSNDMALCEAIIEMAHKLQIKVIAEGVETEEQSQLLKYLGCDYGQGYLFSKPVPANEFEALLSNTDLAHLPQTLR
jgi:diguanylate cyclase (GGDEF)-like protein/PAS domain S-box-containing protein